MPSPAPTSIRLAHVGAGYWGPNLIRNFSQQARVERLVVCDLDAARLDKMRTLYPGIETTRDFQAVLADPDIDAVSLALPAHLHHPTAKAALLAGKHVLVEKPLARTLAEAEDLVATAAAQGRVLMVGHTFLYSSPVAYITDCVKSGEIGEVYYILCQRLNLGRVRQDINAWWNLAPHDVSMVLEWLDGERPETVKASGFSFLQDGVEDVVFANLRFPSGRGAHIHVSWLHPKKMRSIVIVGSKKMLVYDDVSPDAKVMIYDKGIDKARIPRDLPQIESFGQFQFMHRVGDVLIPKIDFREPLAAECGHFIDCALTGARPRTSGENGLQVVDVLERVEKSLKAGQEASSPAF